MTESVPPSPAHGRGAGGEGTPKGRRQVVKFSFFRVDPAWRALPAAERDTHKAAFAAAVDSFSDRLHVRSYSVVGMRGDADFLLWQIGDRLDDIQALHTTLLGTSMGPYLSLPYSYLAMTRRSVYVSGEEAAERTALHPADSRYFFVYPFVKTRDWYQLPLEERQAMMNEHIRVGRKYPSVKLNTTYSFGLDDQEFVVSFETDEPADFLDLVMELREAKTSLYTLRDTPIFTCIALPLRETLDTLASTVAHGSSPEADTVRATGRSPQGGGVDTSTMAQAPSSHPSPAAVQAPSPEPSPARPEALVGRVDSAAPNPGPSANPAPSAHPEVSKDERHPWTPVAALADLPQGTSTVVYHQGEQVALFHTEAGVFALANRCSHANGPLADGVVEGNTVTCPYHSTQFDLATGFPLCGPASRPVARYHVKLEDGRIYLPTKNTQIV